MADERRSLFLISSTLVTMSKHRYVRGGSPLEEVAAEFQAEFQMLQVKKGPCSVVSLFKVPYVPGTGW